MARRQDTRGPQGPRGSRGPMGPQGKRGDNGARGAQGTRGRTGPIGRRGKIGKAGHTGAKGLTGPLHKDNVLDMVMTHFDDVYAQLNIQMKRMARFSNRSICSSPRARPENSRRGPFRPPSSRTPAPAPAPVGTLR